MDWFQRIRNRLREDPRFSRVLHGGFSGLLGRGLTLLINIVTLPLTLRYLGRFEYGIWVTVSTTIVMLSVLDLGVANTLNNFVAEAHAEGDQQKAQHYFATAFWATIALLTIVAPIAYVFWHRVDWGNVFHVSDPALASSCATCVAVAGAFFFLSMPLTLAGRVLGGYQQAHLANYFSMINSVTSLSAVLLTVALHGSLVTLMVLYSAAMLAGPLSLNLWLCFWQRPWIKPLPSRVSPHLVRQLFRQGLPFFFLQLSGIVVFNSDNLVITHYVGASAVTPYSIAWKLTQYATLFQGLLIPSLWPAFTEAYHNRQMGWVNKTYRWIRRKTLMGAAIAGLLIGTFGPLVIRIWVGPGSVPERNLLWMMALFALIMSATNNQALLLSATGHVTFEATVAVLAAIVNLGLSIYLVQRLGVYGVIGSTIISFLAIMIIPQAQKVRRILSGFYLVPKAATADTHA